MSAALPYREPYRFSAGALALTVHLFFFAVLYFGVRWQSREPEVFMVDMWGSLPETEAVPAPAPSAPPAAVEPAPQPKVTAPVQPPVKAEIELREKTKKKAKAEEKPVRKSEKKEKAANRARLEKERQEFEQYEARHLQSEQERIRNEVSAATRTQVERYQSLIQNKIRRNRKEVADVPENAEAIFKVTLLPDGTLMDDPVLVKSSGYPAYDEAAERAILAAQPLPMPDDVSLKPMFRELTLHIKP